MDWGTLTWGGLTLRGSTIVQDTDPIGPSHCAVQFRARRMTILNVRGELSEISGTIVYGPKNLAGSSIDAVIDVNSINTHRRVAIGQWTKDGLMDQECLMWDNQELMRQIGLGKQPLEIDRCRQTHHQRFRPSAP